jgi:serine/threonine protein kinase
MAAMQEGRQYLAMELVEGETLEQRLKAGPLLVEDALQIALQIAQALEAAHEKGVVRRRLEQAAVCRCKIYVRAASR